MSTTDPECRVMGQSDGGYAPSYNVQISTDAKEKAVVAVSVSQSPADQTLLPSAMDEIERTTGGGPGQLVVDAGFTTREAIITAEERGIDLIGSFIEAKAGRETALRSRGIAEAFYPEKFRFDPERDIFTCPEGKVLIPSGRSAEKGKTIYSYKSRDCRGCPSKPTCCPKAPKGRSVTRVENDPRVGRIHKKDGNERGKGDL